MTSRYICSSSLMRARVPAASPAKPAPPLPGGLRRAYVRSRSRPERLLHLVEPGDQPSDVVGVDALELEADDAGPPIGRGAEDADAGNLRQPVHRLRDELVLVTLDRLETDRGDVVERDPEAVGLGDS